MCHSCTIDRAIPTTANCTVLLSGPFTAVHIVCASRCGGHLRFPPCLSVAKQQQEQKQRFRSNRAAFTVDSSNGTAAEAQCCRHAHSRHGLAAKDSTGGMPSASLRRPTSYNFSVASLQVPVFPPYCAAWGVPLTCTSAGVQHAADAKHTAPSSPSWCTTHTS